MPCKNPSLADPIVFVQKTFEGLILIRHEYNQKVIEEDNMTCKPEATGRLKLVHPDSRKKSS